MKTIIKHKRGKTIEIRSYDAQLLTTATTTFILLLWLILMTASAVMSFSVLPTIVLKKTPNITIRRYQQQQQNQYENHNNRHELFLFGRDHADESQHQSRREIIQKAGLFFSTSVAYAFVGIGITPANALIKGNAPPPPKGAAGDRPKCKNVEECQAQAEIREQQQREEAEADSGTIILSTSKGTRYRDYVIGTGPEAKQGDSVTVYYKVLKLGKRSYDGISGEGTVVFSRGYGYDNDEKQEKEKSFTTIVGAYSNIASFNDAITGMKVGGIRRFAILPQDGWRKPGKQCDGGPGGSGAGGELRTDYVVVPTATMVDAEKCFDMFKQPFPVDFGQQRRMAQRFDQSLIMEVELAKVGPGDASLL